MLPSIAREQDCRSFKFWFNGTLRDGMFYQNKLFYRLQTVAATHRPRLYQQACQIAQHGAVVVTISEQECSLWLSLRSAKLPQSISSKPNPQSNPKPISE